MSRLDRKLVGQARHTKWLRKAMVLLLVFGSVTFTRGVTSCDANEPIGSTSNQTCDPGKVISPENCATCHQGEYASWMATPHADTFRSLHRDPKAQAIAQRMGVTSIKRSDACRQCHYTTQDTGRRLKTVAGVSCESCHGAAADWVTVHNDYGGPGVSKAQETAEHKVQRREQSMQLGMNNPTNLYLIAENCLSCHTVGQEALVNHGQHVAGSSEFELVAWSQGKVRHNFLRTDNQYNAISSNERLRVMYVVGLIADLEQSTRAVGQATSNDTFGRTAAQRAADRATKLDRIQQVIDHPILDRILDDFALAELRTNNHKQLQAIAERIRRNGIEFAGTADGTSMTDLDAWLPAPSEYR